jgi:hypothetical protein
MLEYKTDKKVKKSFFIKIMIKAVWGQRRQETLISKTARSKWLKSDSSGRACALQVGSPEFKPSPTNKNKQK